MLQAALIGWPFNFGGQQRFVTGFLPSGLFAPFKDVSVSVDRIWLLGIAVVLSTVLWAVYKFTRFGLATRAVAENQEAAASLGRSPELIATVNWAAGAGLAGLAGILVVPIIGLSVNQVLLLLVPALAAALVGGFTSFPLTLMGGVLIGVIEAELTSNADWIPDLLQAARVVEVRSLHRHHRGARVPRAGSADPRQRSSTGCPASAPGGSASR